MWRYIIKEKEVVTALTTNEFRRTADGRAETAERRDLNWKLREEEPEKLRVWSLGWLKAGDLGFVEERRAADAEVAIVASVLIIGIGLKEEMGYDKDKSR